LGFWLRTSQFYLMSKTRKRSSWYIIRSICWAIT
jgi:hypothetical protein